MLRAGIQEIANLLRTTFADATERARSKRFVAIGAGALSVLLHLALVVLAISASVRSGDPKALPVVLVESFAPRSPIRESQRDPAEDPPPLASENDFAPPEPAIEPPASASLHAALVDALQPNEPVEPPSVATPTVIADVDETAVTFIDEQRSDTAPPVPPTIDLPRVRTVEIAPQHQSSLIERVANAAQTLTHMQHTQILWKEDGREYRAVLKRATAENSMELEKISAEITTTDQGMSMQTQLLLSRLAFSQFTQVVDRWDPNVQLHDDEIVGRFHSNSSVFIANDSSATPKFTGKVTTAARNLRFMNGTSKRRRADMFQGGLETSAGRIELPKAAAPFELEPPAQDAHVQRFDDDVHITLHGDGSYSWRLRKADTIESQRYDVEHPLYLLAKDEATLFLRGTVRGRVLAYSPRRIVIEGSLTYATDPRVDGDSEDYLGLVSDANVEIARPYVTGRGDLRIDGAIFARRRFLVTDIDRRRAGTLSIYGSLTTGTISATEPRYATKIEFDPRFDRVRPPGFPSTNRFEVASWNPQWREASTAH